MWPCCDDTSSDDDEHNTDNTLLLLFADAHIAPALLAGLSEVDELKIALGCRLPWTSSPLLNKIVPHLIVSPYHLILGLSLVLSHGFDCYVTSVMVVEHPALHSWGGTRTPFSSPCRQTVLLCCDDR